jgi:hypothetical protein
MPGYPLPNPKGFPPMPPMYPWPGYGQHLGHGYEQPQQDKDGNVKNPGPQAHGYPPYGFPRHGYAQPQQEENANAQTPRPQAYGFPPYGFPGHGYPGMPPYPHPISTSPSLPPSTPAPSAVTAFSGTKRSSPLDSSKRSASLHPDAAVGRNDASGHSRAPRVKRELGVEDHLIAIEDHGNPTNNDSGEAAEEVSSASHEQALNEIAEYERYIQTLKARLAAQSRL